MKQFRHERSHLKVEASTHQHQLKPLSITLLREGLGEREGIWTLKSLFRLLLLSLMVLRFYEKLVIAGPMSARNSQGILRNKIDYSKVLEGTEHCPRATEPYRKVTDREGGRKYRPGVCLYWG